MISLNSRKGLTLLEVLTSLGIFTMVLGSSLYVMTKTQQFSEDSRARLIAMNAMNSVLETIKETTLPNVPNINLNSYIPAELNNGLISMATSSATGNLSVDPIATITVAISWTGPNQMARSLQLTTMRSRY